MGRACTGVRGEGTVGNGGFFSSALSTAVRAHGYSLGLYATCIGGGCVGVNGEGRGGGVAGIGHVGISGTARRDPGLPLSVPEWAGLFTGNVQVTEDLNVAGTLRAPVIAELQAQIAVLTARLATLEEIVGGTTVRIEAENYDVGGEGVGYHDTTPGNQGGAYRAEDVDVRASSGGGFVVGWIAAGEWLAYTVDVPVAGVYTIGGQWERRCLGAPSASLWTASLSPALFPCRRGRIGISSKR